MGQRKERRFESRRDEIVIAASRLLNLYGASELRITDIADVLGLDNSSINYYFRKKDMLIAACLERSVTWLEQAATRAAAEGNSLARTDALLKAQFELFENQRAGAPPLALLSDLPSLVDEARMPVEKHLESTMRAIADFFTEDPPEGSRLSRLLATNVLASNIFWMPAWQEDYATCEFARLRGVLVSLFAEGMLRTPPVSGMPPQIVSDGENDARTAFLEAAIRLINRQGHNGARVEKVAAELGLSTGSFYHHLRTKNELITACFDRSFAVFDRGLEIAESAPTKGAGLLLMARSIGHYQLTAKAPLLRIGSYQALPEDLRREMIQRNTQLTNRIIGVMSQGMADGSVRVCDAGLAARYFLAAVYGLSDLREWSRPGDEDKLVNQFSSILIRGID